jgi:D-serine deaminase-like pyridoxal phosphate-dependent protein
MDRLVNPRQKAMQVFPDIPSTPALVIDESIVARNLKRLAAYASEHHIGIRPHTKTHKSIEMAKWQIGAGAIGLTAAKVGEAEAMVEASNDVLLAYPAVDAARCGRLAVLAKSSTIHVAVDSQSALNALSHAAQQAGSRIGILVDLDVGMHRTGVQSPQAALELAQAVEQFSSLRLDGLFFYPGHVWDLATQQGKPLGLIASRLEETLSQWSRSGLAAPIVSGGSTPTAYQSHLIPQATEIRPGTYIYNDMNTVAAGFCTLEDCAAKLVCTVVSNAVPGKVVIDAGTKTLTSDRNVTQPGGGHGWVVEYPQAKIIRLSEEHGEVDITACERAPSIGDRVHVIPNHICPCVNLQDAVWLQTSDGLMRSVKIDTRGKLS